MQWLNYHHLLYFWMIAKHGGITKAGTELRLRPQTLSAQIRQLEESLGEKLFERAGRRLVLTEVGTLVYGFAEQIFSLGREMLDTVKVGGGRLGLTLVVGVADSLPKLVALRLLQPAFSIPEPLRLVCREGQHEKLLAALAVHELDLVLSDAPATPAVAVRAFNHLLGECGVSFFAARRVAGRLKGRFPTRLAAAPFILPTDNTALRRSLDGWFERHGVRPRIVGEFEDSALLKAFGQTGAGVFAAPSVLERDIQRRYEVRVVGRTDEIRERFYAISTDRKLKHPAVVAISEARGKLFG